LSTGDLDCVYAALTVKFDLTSKDGVVAMELGSRVQPDERNPVVEQAADPRYDQRHRRVEAKSNRKLNWVAAVMVNRCPQSGADDDQQLVHTALVCRRGTGGRDRPVQPPNIVWICADDFTPDACGAYGNAIVRTPHLDRLAKEGIRFDRAYCACPLSTPSRQAFWTGRYPRAIGVTLSRTPLPDDEVTLPTLLRRSGYEVAAFGKTHYYWPRRHEFDLCVDMEEYKDWLAAQERIPLPRGVKVLGPWRPLIDPAAVWLNSACLPYAAVDARMFGTFLASEAARYLERSRPHPFFLYVSFYETHSPFWFPVEYAGRHDPRSFPAPKVGPEDRPWIPRVFRDLSDADKQGIQAAYATTAEFMDKNVGIVLDALNRSPHSSNTLVIFTSDHGYLLGQHGRFEKHCCFEPAVRAALLIRYPRLIRKGRSSGALIELIDLLPTILELCRVALPSNLHGRSFAPLLREHTALHRQQVVAEYSDNAEAMIRTTRWKFIYGTGKRRRKDGYALDRAEPTPFIRLYDLDTDPDETTNLANIVEHARLVQRLIRELADHVVATARDRRRFPQQSDGRAILDCCLSPSDTLSDRFLRQLAAKYHQARPCDK